jgi:hypothetical protein
MEIHKASRTGVKPIICFYSESGCGKTMSALLLARGFVGPTGKIVMIDTESGRGSLYADVIQGGYDVLELREPFSPSRYIEAVKIVENSGAQVGVLDSGSHEWEGLGGVIDMATEREQKSGKSGLHNWREPKLEHQKFMLKLLQSPLPWIICLRAKFKTRQGKNAQGRTEIVKDEHTSPIQAEDFIFETTCHGEVMPDHTFRLTKCSHPALRQAMPNNEMTTIHHGERLAAWCAAPGGPGVQANGNGKGELLSKLRTLTVGIHGWTKDMKPADWQALKPKLEQFLWDKAIIADTENLGDLDSDRLKEVIDKTTVKLKEMATA